MAEETVPPARSRRTAAAKAPAAADPGLEALQAARSAADAAQARLAEAAAAAEALAGRLDEQTRSAEAAFAGLSERIARRLAEAEGAAAKAGEAPLAQLAEAIAAQVAEAEAAARTAETAQARFAAGLDAAESAGDRLRAGLTEALAAAEESYGKLMAQAEADRQAPLAAGVWPRPEVAEGLIEARRQVLAFIAGRIRQGLEAQAELMACRNLEDMRAVQGRFMREAVDEYVNEAGVLMRLGGDVAAKAMPRVRSR